MMPQYDVNKKRLEMLKDLGKRAAQKAMETMKPSTKKMEKMKPLEKKMPKQMMRRKRMMA